MDLLNATNMQAAYTQGMDKAGREYLVVVVKGTFTLPLDGGESQMAVAYSLQLKPSKGICKWIL